jgi:Peptidase M15
MHKNKSFLFILASFIFVFTFDLQASSAQSNTNSFYNTLTCNWFGYSCSSGANTQIQNTNNNNNNVNNSNYTQPVQNTIYEPGRVRSFWENFAPNWVSSENKNVNIRSNINPDTINNSENTINPSDLGIKSPSKSNTLSDLLTELLTPAKINEKKKEFDACIADPRSDKCRSAQASSEGYNSEEILENKTQPEIDNLSGEQSPHYDSGEPGGMVGTAGPEQPAVSSTVPDSQIDSGAKSIDGSKVFVDKGTGNCTNYGMIVGGSCPDTESYVAEFKLTTARFCALTGKKVVITSGNRSPACNARVGGAKGSSHMSGKAMDTAFSNLSGDEKVVAYLYFVGQGFNNLGGYGANKALHMDMRNSVNRWGRNYSYTSCSSGNYPDYARKAFSLMGLQPCQRDSSAPSRARAALIKMGKQEFTVRTTNQPGV